MDDVIHALTHTIILTLADPLRQKNKNYFNGFTSQTPVFLKLLKHAQHRNRTWRWNCRSSDARTQPNGGQASLYYGFLTSTCRLPSWHCTASLRATLEGFRTTWAELWWIVLYSYCNLIFGLTDKTGIFWCVLVLISSTSLLRISPLRRNAHLNVLLTNISLVFWCVFVLVISIPLISVRPIRWNFCLHASCNSQKPYSIGHLCERYILSLVYSQALFDETFH